MRQRFNLSISVFVLVEQDGKILLLRRAGTGWMDGHFSLPAGGHDGAEPLNQAAARELFEETGLVAAPETLQLVHTLHCRQGDSGEWLGLFFRTASWQGVPELKELDKHDALVWCSLDALPTNTIGYTRQGILQAQAGVAFSSYGWPEQAL